MRMGAPTRRVQQPATQPPIPQHQQQVGLQEGPVNRPLGIGNRNVGNNKTLPRHEVVIRQGVNANGNPVTVMNQSARPIKGATTKRNGVTVAPSHQQQQQNSFLEALNSQTSSSQLSTATSAASGPSRHIPAIHPQSSAMNDSQDEFDRELLRDLNRFRSEQRAGQAQTPLGRAAAESSGFINIGLTNLNLGVSPLPTPLPMFNESNAYYTPMQCYAPFVKSPSTEVRSRPPAQRPTQIVIDPQNRQNSSLGVTHAQRSRSHHRSMTPGSVTSSVALNDVMAQQNFFPTSCQHPSSNPPPPSYHRHFDDDDDDEGVDLFTPGNRTAPPPQPPTTTTTTSHQAEVPDIFNPLSKECLQQSIQHWKTNPFTSSVHATTNTSPSTTTTTKQSLMGPIEKRKVPLLRFPSTLALVCPAKAIPYQRQGDTKVSPSSSKYKTPSTAPTTSGFVSDATRTATHYVTGCQSSSSTEWFDVNSNNITMHNGERPISTTTPACSEPMTARRVAGRKTPRDDSRYGLHEGEDGPRPPPHTTAPSSRVVSPVPVNNLKTTQLLRQKVLKPLRFEVGGIIGIALGNPNTNQHPAVSNRQLPYNVLQKYGNAELNSIHGQIMSSSEDMPISPLQLSLTDEQLERNMFGILKQRLNALSNRVADARDGVVAARGIEMSLLENLERLQQL